MRSMTHLLFVIFAAVALLPLAACDKDAEEPDYEWPDQPADGCPVAIEFVEMIGEGENREASLRLFNFSEDTVTGLQLTLHYLNEAGDELDTFPWGVAGGNVVSGNGVSHTNVGAFMPDDTARVGVTVSQVTFSGGDSWSASE